MNRLNQLKKVKWKALGLRCLCAAFLIFIFVSFLANRKLFADCIPDLVSHEITFSEFTAKVAENYCQELKCKDFFVNVNGLFANKTGQNFSNDRVKLKNGMLIRLDDHPINMDEQSQEIIGLKQWLENSEIPFLYVLMPYKIDLNEELAVPGVDNWGNRNCDSLVNLLREGDVDCVDLRQELSANAQQVAENFYRTDHHWNGLGALRAAKIIMDHLDETYPGSGFRTEVLNEDQWTVCSKKDWFLGSDGRRVGSTFAGVDDLIWAVPNFETDMSCSIPHHRKFFRGDFSDAVLRKSYLEKRDYFHSNPYCIFIGSDYDIVQHRNYHADVKQKVLILKDSFSLPLQAFLSTAFQEIDVLDLRYLKSCTMADYIRETQPDLVIMAHTINVKPGDLGSMDTPARLTLSVDPSSDGTEQQLAVPLMEDRKEVVEATEHRYSNEKLVRDAVKGMTYQIHLDNAEFTKGSADQFSLVLWDETSNDVLESAVCDIEQCKAQGGFDWTVTVPNTLSEDAACHILVYAGLRGEADHKELTITGLDVSQRYSQAAGSPAQLPLTYELKNKTVEIEASENRYNHKTVLDDLELGAKYTITIPSAEFTEGSGNCFTILLYDEEADHKTLRVEICDVPYLKETGEYSWTFFTPEESAGPLSIIIYSGINGAAENKALKIQGMDIAYHK